jgi:hypothetical protein
VESEWFEPVDAVQAAFDRLPRSERRQRQAEAAKIEALLAAFEVALSDLHDRYGKAGGRSGAGARSFLKQVAAELQMTEGAVGHLLDAASHLRESMPATWAVFLDGGAPWRAVDVALGRSHGVPGRGGVLAESLPIRDRTTGSDAGSGGILLIS